MPPRVRTSPGCARKSTEGWGCFVSAALGTTRYCGATMRTGIEESIRPVIYVGRRFFLKQDPMKPNGAPDQESLKKIMLTKYVHWRYENEYRIFVPIDPNRSENGLHFSEFGPHLKLVTVVVGALSVLSREQVMRALGDLAPEVQVIKARLAFRSFRVVRQRGRELW